MRNENDLILIKKIKAGDHYALDKLVESYIPQLLAFFRYLHVPESMLDDMVQDTLIKVINKLDMFDENKKFSTWLLTIARNLYLDVKRRDTKLNEIKQEIVSNTSEITNVSPETEIVGKYTVEGLLQNLTSDERLLVELRVFQDASFAEIAELTGELETTLRSRFFRILNRLRK